MSGGPVYLEKSHLEKQPILMGIWKGGNKSKENITEGHGKGFEGLFNFVTGITEGILQWIKPRLEYTVGQNPPIIQIYNGKDVEDF